MADAVPPKVLIVDDDPTDGELTQRRLGSLAAEFEFHAGPEGAVERIEQGEYRVVLLDLNMPGISGLQILNALKAHGDRTEVLLYSSMEPAALAEIGKTAGVATLPKSATREELCEAVSELMSPN